MTSSEVHAIPRTFVEAGIHVPATVAEKFSTTCPACSHARKKSHTKCLTVWTRSGTWSCNHCGWKGRLFLHADGTTNRLDESTHGSSKPLNAKVKDKNSSQKCQEDTVAIRFLSQQEVDSFGPGYPAGFLANLECTNSEERAAIQESEGLTRPKARVEARLGVRRFLSCPTERTAFEMQNVDSVCGWFIALTRPTLLDDWYVSGQADGSVIFFYVDCSGLYRTAKKFWFDRDGHKSRSPITLYTVQDGFRSCLYGEHQLMPGFVSWNGIEYDESVPVILVESEKTVLLASHHRPEYIWIGTSGTRGLTKEKAKVLRGRNVVIWFDRDEAGREGSFRAASILRAIGVPNLRLVDPYRLWPNKPDGYDVADFIVENVEAAHA